MKHEKRQKKILLPFAFFPTLQLGPELKMSTVHFLNAQSSFYLFLKLHFIPKENSIQKQFIGSKPCPPKIGIVNKMNDPSLTHR